MGKQGLHVFPQPLSPIPNDTQPHGVLGNQAGVFDLLQRFAQIVFAVYLVPAEDMHDALAVQQVKAKSLRLTPLVAPPRPSGTMPCLAWATSPCTVGTRRHIGPINPQYQHRTTKT